MNWIQKYQTGKKLTKKQKAGQELQDLGSRMLYGLQTFGGSYIGDAIQGISPKAASAVSKYTAGMIAPTPKSYLERNRKDWLNRGASAADATSMILAGEMLGPLAGKAGKVVKGTAKKLTPQTNILNKLPDGTLTKMAKFANDRKPGIIKDYAVGAVKGIKDIQRGRPVFETFPITRGQKKKIIGMQDAAHKEGMDFLKMWTEKNGKLDPVAMQKMEPIRNQRFDAWDKKVLTAPNYKDELINSSSSAFRKLSKNKRNYLKERRGTLEGVQFNEDPLGKSYTFRNNGLYYKTPHNVAKTGVHEATHSFQKVADWAEGMTAYYPEYEYYSPNRDFPIGKLFQDIMVPPQKGQAVWAASPSELHAEMMAGRFGVYRKTLKEARRTAKSTGNILDEASFKPFLVKQIKNPTDDTVDRIIKEGALGRFMNDKKGSLDGIKAAVKYLPAGAGVAVATKKQKGGAIDWLQKGSGIHIKKENRGKFTKKAKAHGMGVQEFARYVLSHKDEFSTETIKQANFARNASKWN